MIKKSNKTKAKIKITLIINKILNSQNIEVIQNLYTKVMQIKMRMVLVYFEILK